MILWRPTMTFGWPLTAIMAAALVLLPVSGLVFSDEPVAPSVEQQPQLASAANPVSFRYDEGTEQKERAGKETAVRVQERSIPAVQGNVFVYASFDALRANPAELVLDEPRGMQTVAIGHGRDGDFSPCVSFGVVKDTHSGLGNRALLLPWLSDGKLDHFGMFARPQTPYDFKLKLDLQARRMTVWVSGRGDDDWFLLAENVPLEHPLESIDSIRVEQNAGAPGVRVAVQSIPWPEAEQVRPHPQPKERVHVVENEGFTFQSMRSTWQQPGKQVTIARNNPKNTPTATAWLGFPDVLQIGPKEFLCTFTGGAAHGGGGPILVSRSDDLGQTWSDPVAIHPSGVNCSRIQKLNDGSILVLADVSAGTYCVVFYRSTDGGRTWEKISYLDPPKVGGHGACVPSRVAEMPDGSWLIAGSWVAGNPFELKDGEQLELYRSADRGATWELHSIVKEYPRSLSEASFVQEPGGKLWMFIREACRILPGVKTWSDDGGKTWARCEELPFPIVGRTCAAPMKDGRILLTTRYQTGRAGLWAWVSDLAEKTQAGIVAAHFNDSRSVGLKEGELHLDNDGLRGQFTQYYLRAPDSPDSKLDVTAEVKVVSNQGYAATLSIPYVGKLRILENQVVMAHDPTLTAKIAPGVFHSYRVLAQGGKMTLLIDGVEAFVSDKADHRVIRSDWTPLKLSPYLLAFGNEPTFLSSFEFSQGRGEASVDEWEKRYQQGILDLQQIQAIPPIIMLNTMVARDQITPRVSGYSVWKRIESRFDDPITGVREQSWHAARDGFPDQYMLDRVLEVDASIGGGDQGYSGWTETEDGRIFVVNYTDDTAPACLATPNWPTGLPWIRGTFLSPEDLPPVKPKGSK